MVVVVVMVMVMDVKHHPGIAYRALACATTSQEDGAVALSTGERCLEQAVDATENG